MILVEYLLRVGDGILLIASGSTFSFSPQNQFFHGIFSFLFRRILCEGPQKEEEKIEGTPTPNISRNASRSPYLFLAPLTKSTVGEYNFLGPFFLRG